MKRTWTWASITAVVGLSVGLVALPAVADPGGEGGNTNCNGAGNPNSPCGGAGGGGGAGGEGGAGGSATATATSTNVNTNVNTQGQQQGQQQGQIQGQQQGQGQVQGNKNKVTTTVTVEGDRTEIPAQAPAIFSPNLTSSPEACMGSISGGGGAGFNGISFGFNLGSTWTNQECQDRMNARTLSALGQNQAALEYLAAANPKIADSLKRAGVKVAVNEEKVAAAAPAAAVVPAAVKVEKKDAPAEPAASEPVEKKTSEVLGEAMRATQERLLLGVQGS